MLPYTPLQKRASEIFLCSVNDTVDGNRSCSNTAPIFPLLAAGGQYAGAAVISPEDGKTRGIWRPPRCGHRWSGCFPRRNRLATEAYPRLILPYRKKYWEWKAIPKVRLSSREIAASPRAGATAPPRIWQDTPNCTDMPSGCRSPFDCYILRFSRHSSSQISVTSPLDR